MLLMIEKRIRSKSFHSFNPIQDEETKNVSPTIFLPVTSTNVRIIPKNILSFSFKPFSTLVPVPNY